ncbi:MAG TPA: hypothetical protein VFF04_00435 [Candidatus Babeliales bacterium]|nr:hypothetical protein [Candidatus Babeliales bacterium]
MNKWLSTLLLLPITIQAGCPWYDPLCVGEQIQEHVFNPIAQAAETAGSAIKGAAEQAGGAIKGAAETVYEKGLKPAGEFIAARFQDTQTTRAIDFGIRYAALETAHATATATLQSAKAVATGPMIAARETAKAALNAAEGFLETVGKNVSRGVLSGSATAAKGILEGVKQGTVWTLEGTRFVLTQGLANMFDINRIYYKESLSELKNGVLGNVKIDYSIFNQSTSASVTIDAKASFDAFTTAVKPFIDSVVHTLQDKVFNPVKNAVEQVHDILAPTQHVTVQPITPPAQLAAQLQAAKLAAQQAQQQAAQVAAQQQQLTQAIAQDINAETKKADQALQEKKNEFQKQAFTQLLSNPLLLSEHRLFFH